MIVLNNMSFSYKKGGKEIFKNVNMQFDAGLFYVLYGKSGIGKTTFLKLLGGLLSPTSGRIEFCGKDINDLKNNYRKENISLIFQDYCLIPYMTPVENVQLALGIQGQSRSDYEICKMFNEFDISEEECSRRVSRLSGGEQQRVAIVRSVILETDCLLADEPTGNLDEENELKIIKLLKDIAYDKGKCVIVASHSKEVLETADIAYRVRNGELVQEMKE